MQNFKGLTSKDIISENPSHYVPVESGKASFILLKCKSKCNIHDHTKTVRK